MPYRKMNTPTLTTETERLLNEWYSLEKTHHDLLDAGDMEGAYEAQKAAKAKYAEYIKAKAELNKRA